ncbi:Rad53p [Rhizophagus irregularis DAOM 197198w]|uniref:Rad53p n=1 Tax=Rhizophagus irregularis (strain DAOM 197198w) TaxID=1432141 RepID=A0A015LSR6_RHIIW|nr:Rad53p [Rhizophagus irregularis DAOM 197198w]
MEHHIKEKNIEYYNYDEFTNIEELGVELVNKVYKANWKHGKLIALKSINLTDEIIKEVVREVKIQQENDLNNAMIKLYGITSKTNSDEYLLVVEYAEGGSFNNYLKVNFPSLNWRDKYELAFQLSSAIEYLHEREIVHKDLHSSSILVQQNSIRLADSGLSKRIKDSSRTYLDTIPYTDPRGFDIEGISSDALEKYESNEKSNVYSVGVLFWELSSGKKPFSDKEYNSILAEEIAQGLREVIVDGTPKNYCILYEKCWDGDPDKRPTIQDVVTTLKSMIKQQLMIQKFNLNYGLFLDGYSIKPSKQAVFTEDGELNMSSYEEQPSVYTSINDHNSRINLLNFNSDDNGVELHESLRSSDICINFPVSEITYTSDLSEIFSNFTDEEESLYEMYGHLVPRKILIGGKLFIDGLESVNSTQIDIFNSYLTRIHDSAKHKKEIQLNDSSALNFCPKIITTDGINLDTHEKLTDWMNNLYQDDTGEIISYNNLVPISQLKFDTKPFIDEKQPGVANFKEKLTLENWAQNSKYVRLVREFQLLKGLIIDQNFKLKTCGENAIDLINLPKVDSNDSNDKFYLEIVKPKSILEEILIDNNIFPTENNEDISSFPFLKVLADNLSYEDKAYFLVKCERYNITLNRNNIKPSEKFKEDIDKALGDMKPLISLQKVFDKYGHFIPLNILLGKSLKNIIENLSNISEKIDLALPVFESLKLHLEAYNIKVLLTQKGDVIEENGLSEWIQNTKHDLEVIELNNIIPLYNILEVEQTRRIDTILNKQDKSRIIMTGTVDLKDSDITKQIIVSVKPSLDNKNYEAFGSIVSKNNSKLDDIFVTFGSYENYEFSATIETSKNTNISIEECYIIWIIIGNPSELSVFCPNNREIQVDYFKESITLQRNDSSYSIKTSRQLSQGSEISINCFKPINVKLTGWSKNGIQLNISDPNINSNHTQTDSDNINIDIAVCVSNSNHENSKVNINGNKYSMGCILTENNFLESMSNIQKYINNKYPTKKEREKERRLIINKKNLEGHFDLSDFINLEKIDCSENQITSLDISKNKLLTDINCSNNKLTSLDLRNCLNIKSVTANCNQLNELKLLDLNNEKLEYLNLLDNSFSQNLNCFGHLVNLKELLIGNIDGDRIQQGKYNQFYGSLEPLESLIKLESLSIGNSDIDSGLEFLSDSIKNFRCLADRRPEAKVKIIYEQLEVYTLGPIDASQGRYNLKAWKVNWQLANEKKALQDQITQIEKELSLDTQFIELIEEENNLNTEKENLIENNIQIKEEIKRLKQKVEKLSDELEEKEIAYQQTKQQLEEKIELLNSLTIEQYMKKEGLGKEIDVLKDELEKKKNIIEQLEMQLKKINSELKIKEDESKTLESKLDKIELIINDKKEELKVLQEKFRYERCYTKANTSNLRSKIDNLKSELKKQALESKKMKNELKTIRKEKKTCQDEQNSKKANIENLQKEKDNLRYKLVTRTNELNDKEEIISELKQQNKQHIEELQNRLDEEIKKYNKLQKKNAHLKEKLSILEKIIQDCKEETSSDTD